MTCERHDPALALYVEGDLPRQAVPRLERHLLQCPRCQEFLQGLKRSQQELKGLAMEPIEATALAEVRERVLAGASGSAASRAGRPAERSHPPRRAWRWALAAALAGVALALAFIPRMKTGTSRPTASFVATSPTTKSGPVTPSPVRRPQVTSAHPPPGRVAPALSSRRSTSHLVRAVSRGMGPETPQIVPTLSPEDADALARAVVAVSRTRKLSDRPAAAPLVAAAPPAALARFETSDPNVVIYWQLDPNGG